MSCGKRVPKKLWDKPRTIRKIKPSRYEQNEASVKIHWQNVIHKLEMSYKDDQFWETNGETVRELVGPVVFQRIAKIFALPVTTKQYEPTSLNSSLIIPSTQNLEPMDQYVPQSKFSISDYEPSGVTENIEEDTVEWSDTSSGETRSVDKKVSNRAKTISVKSISKRFSKSMTKLASRTFAENYSKSTRTVLTVDTEDSEATSQDDLDVVLSNKRRSRQRMAYRNNPYFDMLYCNESETDMIKWKSHYKQKAFEISASDEFSKRAEILTKQISKDFYDWWVSLGNVEFKSEIKRAEDIEDLFQVWFDEDASRSLMLNPKIVPCVLQSIADYVKVPEASCLATLRRQIAYDVHAETRPAHTVAFGTCLPLKLAHVPPENDTSKQWHEVQVPEDLRTMSCVWEDIQHLTSTKAFHSYLVKHPSMPMPPFFKVMEAAHKKLPFAVPSDLVMNATSSTQDLALPISQFSLELKEVLSKLMNK